MILRPKSSPRHQGPVLAASAAAPALVLPDWLRRSVPDAESLAAKGLGPNAVENVAIAAGAAIGALDAVVRRRERWAGAWRQRLALRCAAVAARQAGRAEDEAALRDTVLLTRPGDDVSPAGLLLFAWRRLACRPARELLTEANLAAVLEEFGYARDDEAVSDLAGELRRLAAGGSAVGMLTGAFASAACCGLSPAIGSWLADALLAQRLGWDHAVPLLGAETAPGMRPGRRRGVVSETERERAGRLLAAQARAALRAIDMAAALERRAERLLGVAPKLRARGADMVVGRLLSGDALVASEKIAGMSDRSLRRLFERLVELGAARELSGRATFRIYGI